MKYSKYWLWWNYIWYWWRKRQQISLRLSMKMRKMNSFEQRLATMMMMMMNYLGAARLNKVFKSFHLPFWQTNACNAELPTQTLNIVKLKFGFNSIYTFRATFWPTHAMKEGFDLFNFSLSWSCCTKSISCSSFSLVVSIHKCWPTQRQYEQVADRTIGQCERQSILHISKVIRTVFLGYLNVG